MSIHNYTDIRIPIDLNNPAIVRNDELCIKCGACRRFCERDMAVGRLYDLESSSDNPICVHCGKCVNVCPLNSISERYDYQKVRKAILNSSKIVIFSFSPSDDFAEGKMAASLRALGADYVFDTRLARDLTIMEETSELLDRIVNKKRPLPQFASCCPAWVKFAETFYPKILPHLSTSKSPIGMQGPIIKTYFARRQGLDPVQIVNVAVTACTALKFEIRRKEMNVSSIVHDITGLRDMDYVITTRELAKWLKEEGIDVKGLKDSGCDSLMEDASGGGVILGNINPPGNFPDLSPVCGMEGIKSASLEIKGSPVRLALVQGIDNARSILEGLKAGKCDYDFIEVMACRDGCMSGGGQLISLLNHENPDIRAVYRKIYEKPLSPRGTDLLHSSYHSRYDDLGPRGIVEKQLILED